MNEWSLITIALASAISAIVNLVVALEWFKHIRFLETHWHNTERYRAYINLLETRLKDLETGCENENN